MPGGFGTAGYGYSPGLRGRDKQRRLHTQRCPLSPMPYRSSVPIIACEIQALVLTRVVPGVPLRGVKCAAWPDFREPLLQAEPTSLQCFNGAFSEHTLSPLTK